MFAPWTSAGWSGSWANSILPRQRPCWLRCASFLRNDRTVIALNTDHRTTDHGSAIDTFFCRAVVFLYVVNGTQAPDGRSAAKPQPNGRRLHTESWPARVRSGEVERSGGCKSLWSGGKLPEFRTKELDRKV